MKAQIEELIKLYEKELKYNEAKANQAHENKNGAEFDKRMQKVILIRQFIISLKQLIPLGKQTIES